MGEWDAPCVSPSLVDEPVGETLAWIRQRAIDHPEGIACACAGPFPRCSCSMTVGHERLVRELLAGFAGQLAELRDRLNTGLSTPDGG